MFLGRAHDFRQNILIVGVIVVVAFSAGGVGLGLRKREPGRRPHEERGVVAELQADEGGR